MRFSPVSLVAVLSVASAFACSSTKQDGGLAGPAATTEAAKNPYGVAYPTDNPGYQARKGNIAGNTIRNYKFQGYKHLDPSKQVDMTKGLVDVSLADYFDPEMRTYKIIHLSVAAVWCPPCNQETDDTAQVAAALAAQKVVFVQALDDSSIQGHPADKSDLDAWIVKHKSNFTELLDPGLTNFGQFFDAAAVPWNANVDARTMEILSSGVGAPADITADVTKWTTWVDQHPIAKP